MKFAKWIKLSIASRYQHIRARARYRVKQGVLAWLDDAFAVSAVTNMAPDDFKPLLSAKDAKREPFSDALRAIADYLDELERNG
jgi:dienelactone hydrolase